MAEVTQADGLNVDLRRIVERLTLVAPLGLRFWDEVLGKTIGDGLLVTAYPETQPSRRVTACSNPSGIYVLHHLPGLREVDNGAGDQEFWSTHPPQSPFIIEVLDRERRFQPFLLRLLLPVRGVYNGQLSAGDSPPTGMLGVPLFSTPTRAVPAAMAVLRADLWDPQGGQDQHGAPASWAVLEAQITGRPVVRGMADAQGRIALIFAYPEPVTNVLESSPLASPPSIAEGGTALRQQTWAVTLQAAYAPRDTAPAIPNLDEALAQPPAQLWDVWDDVERTELTSVTLPFGQELIVRSRDANRRPRPALFITPPGSPL
jgi:hypothetical protein